MSVSAPISTPGRFGPYGGRYVPETLVQPLEELTDAYEAARQDPAFAAALDDLLRHFAGRPTPLYFAPRLTAELGVVRPGFRDDSRPEAASTASTRDLRAERPRRRRGRGASSLAFSAPV